MICWWLSFVYIFISFSFLVGGVCGEGFLFVFE